MKKFNQLNKERAIEHLSSTFNNLGIYNLIHTIAIGEFDIYIDDNSDFWTELEIHIIEKVIEEGEK